MEGAAGPGAATTSSSVASNVFQVVETTGLDGKPLLKLFPVSNILQHAEPSVLSPVVFGDTKVNASVPSLVSLKTMFPNTTTSPLVQIPVPLTASPGNLIIQKQLDEVELMKVTSTINKNPTVTSSSAFLNNYISATALSLRKDAASVSSVESNILMNTRTLPVTVNSKILPSGHHLQIPAYAEVKSFPASCLPPAIQKKILAVAATNAPVTPEAAKPPNVIYVSPVKTVKTPVFEHLQDINPTAAAEVAKPFVLTSAQTTINSSVPDAVSCDSQRNQDSPMKWVVQENPQSSASCLVPVRSSNHMISEMLKTLVDRKNGKTNPTGTLPACPNNLSESPPKLNSVKDNAMVMYNGEIYLLTRKRSSTGSAQDAEQASVTADMHVRKHAAPLASSIAADTITNQVVNLVLSKNKGIAHSAKNSKLGENVEPPLWTEEKKKSKFSAVLLSPPQENPQEAASASQNIPVGIKVDDKTVTEEHLNTNNIEKTLSLKTAALPSSANHGVSKEEEQMTEKINSTETADLSKQKKVQHRKQYTEIRKKFGLLKEERVYLKRLPLLNSVIKTKETEWSSSVPMNDACKSLPEITVKPDPEEEEMILEKEESNVKRIAELPEPVLENAKRRRTLTPSVDHEESSSVTDIPSSSCRQAISWQENSISSAWFSSSGGFDPNPCVKSNEENEIPCTASDDVVNGTSFGAGSLGQDSFLSSPPDLEETIKDEKIERLKLLLEKQEEALEEMRKKLQET